MMEIPPKEIGKQKGRNIIVKLSWGVSSRSWEIWEVSYLANGRILERKNR